MSDTIEELETKQNSVTDLRTQIDRLNEMAWEARYNDRDRSRALSEQAYGLATTGPFPAEPYQHGLAVSLRNLSFLNSQIGNYDSALSQSLQAFDILESGSDLASQVDVLSTLSWVYRGFGDYGIALDYAMKALRLAKEIDDRAREATVLDVIGNIDSESNNLDQARTAYDQALQLFQELGEKYGECLVLNNLALTYLQLNENANAVKTSLESLRLAQENGLSALVLTASGTVGEVYLGTEDYGQAILYLQQALSIARERQVSYDEFWSLLNLGKVYHRQHDDTAALSCLNQALVITQESKNRPGQFQCHELLAEVYEKQGNLREALSHWKQFHILKETVFNENTAKRLAGLQVIHQVETARRDAEIQHLKTIELQKEIEDRKNAQAALEELATTDPLTGLLNRREFFVLAEREFQRARSDGRPLSAVLIDLDHFKNVNDTYGHAAGDQVLTIAAKTARDNLRRGEIIARYGGDEFVILLPGSNLKRASRIAERLHRKMNSKIIKTERGKVSITTSFGVAESQFEDGTGLDTLLDHTDQALYAAKRAGRNRTATYRDIA